MIRIILDCGEKNEMRKSRWYADGNLSSQKESRTSTGEVRQPAKSVLVRTVEMPIFF